MSGRKCIFLLILEHFGCLTWKNILLKDTDELISVWPTVLVKETDSVSQLVDDISYFTPQSWASYSQFLAFTSTAAHSRSATRNK